MADKNFLTDIIDADLAEGKISEIHTRFPPEPNGYLHIGSAKAIYINWSIANQYGGKFNLRLDDTNPARDNVCEHRVFHFTDASVHCTEVAQSVFQYEACHAEMKLFAI